MADVFSKEKRSEVMRSIKNKGTKLETDTAKMLRRAKIRYRSHPKMYGSPGLHRRRSLVALLRRIVLARERLEKFEGAAACRQQPGLLGQAHRVQQEKGQES